MEEVHQRNGLPSDAERISELKTRVLDLETALADKEIIHIMQSVSMSVEIGDLKYQERAWKDRVSQLEDRVKLLGKEHESVSNEFAAEMRKSMHEIIEWKRRAQEAEKALAEKERDFFMLERDNVKYNFHVRSLEAMGGGSGVSSGVKKRKADEA